MALVWALTVVPVIRFGTSVITLALWLVRPVHQRDAVS